MAEDDLVADDPVHMYGSCRQWRGKPFPQRTVLEINNVNVCFRKLPRVSALGHLQSASSLLSGGLLPDAFRPLDGR
jgi:hypothetical protein